MRVTRAIKILLCVSLFWLGGAGTAGAWGVLDKAIRNFDFGVDRLLDNAPIRYAVSAEITAEEEKVFVHNLHHWPAEVLRQIRQRNRTEEFADIVPLLERGVRTVKVDAKAPHDILFMLDPALPSRGVFSHTKHEIRVRTDLRQYIRKISLHEIGHYYGLADQYETARMHASTFHSSDPNITAGSIMNDFEHTSVMTCDDVDGFINLIDLRVFQREGYFSKRAERGWKTLCPKGENFYQESSTPNRNEHDTIRQSDFFMKAVSFSNGKPQKAEFITDLKQDLLSLFLIAPGDAVLRDPQNDFISAVVSFHGVPACPLAKNGKKILRKFFYTPTYTNTYDISVQCFQDNVFLREYTIPIGGKLPWSIHWPLAKSGPGQTAHMVSLYFNSEEMVQLEMDSQKILTHTMPLGVHRVYRFPENDLQVQFDDEQPNTFYKSQREGQNNQSFSPQNLSLLMETKPVYDTQIQVARSFYDNFYLMLFPNSQRKIQMAIQQALQTP